MNRPKSRSKRSKVSLVRSQSCRSDMDLSDDSSSLHVSVRSGSDSPANDAKSPPNIDETGTLSDSTTDVLSSVEIRKLRIRNGFNVDQYESLHKDKRGEPKSVVSEVSISPGRGTNSPINDQSTNLSKSTKLHKSASTSSEVPDSSSESPKLVKNKALDVDLPPFEESIIEGFSIMAFNTSSEMELYARLTDKKEATPSRRTSSRSASTAGLNSNLGRQRRCAPRSSVGRGRKSTVHNPTTAGATATAAAAAAAADGLDGDVTAGKGSSSTRGSGNKGDAVRLGPLHIDITSPTSTASSGRKSGGDDDQMGMQRSEAKANGLRISNGDAGSALSADKTFPVLLPKNNTTIATASSASKRDLFSIAALTAVEEREEASSSMVKSSQEQQQQQQQQQSQAYSPQVPQSPQLRPNGHPLTPAQWLERLSNNRGGEMAWNKGGIGMAEEEMRQLTHLLFTDRVFTEQVGRLPSVVQIMAFYHHHQQQQQQQEQLRQLQQPHTPSSSSSSSCSPTTAQSFSNTFNSQQNSLGAGAPQTGAMHPPAALTTNKAFPPPPHPPLPFTPPTASATALAAAAAAVVGCGGSGGSLTTTTATTTIATANLTSIATYFPTPVNSTSAATTTPIHLPPPPPPPPPPLSHSPIFFNSTATAVAAALAAGIRPTAPVFQGQALSLSTGQFLPAPPISNAGTSAPPVPHSSLSHHPFMPNSPHLSTLWGGHHHLPRLQPPASDFPYLVVGPHLHSSPVAPSSSAAHARRATPVVDAVDLTSMAGGGNDGVGSMKRSACARPAIPQSLLSFPHFWAHQRSAVAIATAIHQPQPQPPSSANRRLHQLPRFRDLFRIDGMLSNRGATAHLRICYHIMMDKTHGLKPVNPSTNPWWYVEPSATLPQPKPRERPAPPHPHPHPHPHLSHHQTLPRFPNYEHFMRTALGGGGSSAGGAGGVGGSCTVAPLPPPHPIAIDLTRSPPPHMAGLAMSSARKLLQHQEMPRPVDAATVAKFFQQHQQRQQQQQQQQETELMMALKRRRVMPEGGALVSPPPPSLPPPSMQPAPQLLPPPHYQNGGMRMPLGFPFSPPHFRHPL